MTDDRAAYFAANGHPPEAERRVSIDFDGTIFPRVGIYAYPDPLPGAAENIQRLKRAGYHITIWTSRLWPAWLDSARYSESEMRDYIETLLRQHDIPYDDLIGKPPGVAYIDDIAIRFSEGEWPAITDFILWRDRG